MSTRLMAIILVVGLVFVDTAGRRMLSGRANAVLTLLLILGIILLVVRAAHEYRYEAETVDPATRMWAQLGWKLPGAAMMLASLAVALTAFTWKWQPRADFDVLGILWLLQNVPGIGLIVIFGLIAVFSLVVMLRALAASRFDI